MKNNWSEVDTPFWVYCLAVFPPVFTSCFQGRVPLFLLSDKVHRSAVAAPARTGPVLPENLLSGGPVPAGEVQRRGPTSTGGGP